MFISNLQNNNIPWIEYCCCKIFPRNCRISSQNSAKFWWNLKNVCVVLLMRVCTCHSTFRREKRLVKKNVLICFHFRLCRFSGSVECSNVWWICSCFLHCLALFELFGWVLSIHQSINSSFLLVCLSTHQAVDCRNSIDRCFPRHSASTSRW